jgi:hypothetical protein
MIRLILIVLLLAGCGSTTEMAIQKEQFQQYREALHQESVLEFLQWPQWRGRVYLGDSITKLCAEEYPEMVDPPYYTRAIPASDTRDIIRTFQETVWYEQPTHAYIMVGIVDIMDSISPDDYSRNLRELVYTLRHGSPGIHLQFNVIIPSDFYDHEITQTYNDTLKRTMDELGIPVIDNYETFSNGDGKRNEYYMDGHHLNREGCKLAFGGVR